MTDSQKISPEFGLMEVSGSISDPMGPKTRKTTSERNHNPVSRHFALLENMGSGKIWGQSQVPESTA
jgi:hypothetical protein